jgi:tetratricopeptide (TPR) repeat protein
MFSALASDSIKLITQPQRDNYKILCRYVLNFYKAKLYNDKKAQKFIDNTPAKNKLDSDLLTTSLFKAKDLPPTPAQFVDIVRDGKITEAVEIYEKFKKLNPDQIFFDEATFNNLGYQNIQTGKLKEAIKILKMNANSYPHSANTWDSLAEACMSDGNNEMAIKYYRKALEVLPNDTTASDQLKELIRNGAQTNLENLGG